MYKTLFLLLVASAYCQKRSDADINADLLKIFGRPPSGNFNERTGPGPSTIVPPQTGSDGCSICSVFCDFEALHYPNTEVRKIVALKECVGVKVRKGMLRWFGHVERMDDEEMTKQIYNAKVDGCSSRERLQSTFHDQIYRVMEESYVRSPKSRRACMTKAMNFKEANDSCVTKDGIDGVCVPYYLCSSDNDTIITDGAEMIDIRVLGSCGTYSKCCLEPDVQIKPIKPTKPEPKKGCGWNNPKGADMRTTGDVDGETKFGEFPWMVAVLTLAPSDDAEDMQIYLFVGGGSLIHPSAVLTAAHYVFTPREYRARAGEWDTQSTKEIYPYQERKVASTVVHKDFNKGNLFYDIAILFLEKPMELAPHIGVACLPPRRERMSGGTRCFATGWGKDKFERDSHYQVILKKVEVPVVERSNCQTALRRTRLSKYFELHTSFMCAGGEQGVDVCRGDGGSPLSCPIPYEQDRYMQSGIVAWGIGCGDNGVPGVYVDVANLRDWIDDKMAGKGYDPKTYTYFST